MNLDAVTDSIDVARFRPALDLLTDPPPISLVAEFAWQRGVSVLVSESGAGKTFVLLDLAAAVAGGEKEWHGRPAQAGTVAYVSFEGDALGLRLAALQVTSRDVRHLYVLRAGEPISPRVDREGQETPSAGECALRDSLRTLVAELATAGGPPVVLLLIDTLRASMVGSEDRSEDVAAYLRVVRRLLTVVPDAGAVLAHHAGWQDGETKKKRERGSSAFRGNSDGVFYLEVTADNGELGIADLLLTTLKVRDDAKPAPLRLRRVRVRLGEDDEYGRPRRSCVIETDPRTRADLEAEGRQADATQAAALDDQAATLIRTNRITNQKTLRALLGVSFDAATLSLARLKRLYTLKEAGVYLGVGYGKVRDFVSRGLLPAVRLPGGQGTSREKLIHILVDDLEQFVLAHREAPR